MTTKCQFGGLTINKCVVLDIGNGFCYRCREPIKYRDDAIYRGHGERNGTSYDIFDLEKPLVCGACGLETVQYIELCKGRVYPWGFAWNLVATKFTPRGTPRENDSQPPRG